MFILIINVSSCTSRQTIIRNNKNSQTGEPPVSSGLPDFTYKGVILHSKNLKFSPKNDLIHPTIIKTSDNIKSPLGKYYMYYSPHEHIAVSMAYSDDLKGPWTEFKNNPVIDGPAAPDIRWIEEHKKFFMWAHSNNSKTELWETEDGVHFQKSNDDKTDITAAAINTKNATYTRVYKRRIEGLNNRYMMLYSGLIKDTGKRHIWMAHSNDAKEWSQLKQPLVEPASGENNEIYGPSYVRYANRNYIVYQDNSSGSSGGIIKYVEVNDKFTPVGTGGERHVLLHPPTEDPLITKSRYRGSEFYQDGSTIYMYSGASKKYNEVIIFATATIKPENWGS